MEEKEKIQEKTIEKKIIISNRGEIAGKEIIEELGLVSASVAPSKFITKDLMAMVRQWFGKEMKEYTKMINQAREKVIERMIEKAKELDADAIVNIRFMGTGITSMSAEMMGYGTAVRIKK